MLRTTRIVAYYQNKHDACAIPVCVEAEVIDVTGAMELNKPLGFTEEARENELIIMPVLRATRGPSGGLGGARFHRRASESAVGS